MCRARRPRRSPPTAGSRSCRRRPGRRRSARKAFCCLHFRWPTMQALVDEQLKRRVDRAGAGPPQVLAALGDLLDHLVAVHRPFGEQLEDRGADVAALAASSPAAATATRTAWRRSRSRRADRIRTRSRGRGRSRDPDRSQGRRARVVLAEMVTKVVAELASGLPPLLMKCAAIARAEAEAESAWWWV